MIRATDDGVHVRNRFRSSFHPWKELTHIDATGEGIYFQHDRDRGNVTAIAVQNWTRVPFADKHRATHVAQLLNDERHRRRLRRPEWLENALRQSGEVPDDGRAPRPRVQPTQSAERTEVEKRAAEPPADP